MIEEIKSLRIEIDGLAQLTKELYKPKEGLKNPNNWRVFHPKETEKAVDSLYLTKAWLGKLGNENPYKSGYKTKEDIEPATDVSNRWVNYDDWLFETKRIKRTHIEKVDWLRNEIEKLIKNLLTLDSYISNHHAQRPSREFAIARTNTYNYLCEARFWLEFELERIREEK